jgi:hypothetical protein
MSIGGENMAKKKKKEENIEDILDRIEQDIDKIRNKIWLDKVDEDGDQEDEDSFDDEDEE